MTIKKLSVTGGSWAELVQEWRVQCQDMESEFDDYFQSSPSFQILESECQKLEKIPVAGVFSLLDDSGSHTALWFASGGMTNTIPGDFMRVRHIMMAPKFDSEDVSFSDYVTQFAATISAVIELSRTTIKCPNVKVHFKTRSEFEPLKEIMNELAQNGHIKSTSHHGLWLLIEP